MASTADANRVLLTGENPFIRLSAKDGDPNSTDAADFAKAEELLLSIRPHVRKFHSSEYINALANGDICVAVGFSGDIFQARDRASEAGQGVEISYVIPNEGAQIWFDQMAIPADAPHVEEAHTFLNYIMRPEVIAKASNYVFYANGNKASQPLLDKEVIGDPAIYPPADVIKQLYVPLPYDQYAVSDSAQGREPLPGLPCRPAQLGRLRQLGGHAAV